jgi:undecaprenyl-phosphate 4-deoxy-4-formamido-L-arabinose transferase
VAVLEVRAAPFEIILVNDGSRDRSWDIVSRLTQERPEVLGIDLSRNFGQHNALLCGIRSARYDVVITMDDDLQHPPEEISRLLDKLAEGYDVVCGVAEREPHGWFRGVGSRLMKRVLSCILGVQMGRGVSAFRAFRTTLREPFYNYRSPIVLIDVLLSWGTTRFTTIPVTHHPRRIGASNYTLHGLVAHAVNLFTGFSTWPLRLASWVGFGSIVFGMLVLAWVIGNFIIRGTSQPGFPFLASIIVIFAGAQMFALGILGEYVGQIHRRLMDKPPYVVRSELGPKGKGRDLYDSRVPGKDAA